MPSISKFNGEDLGKAVITLSIVEVLYILIVQGSIASAPAKLYWILNMIACVPLVYIIWFSYHIVMRDTEYKRNLFPVVITIGTITSFTIFLEVFFITIATLFEGKGLGTWFLIIVGLGLTIGYFILSHDARVYSTDNLSNEKRALFLSAR